MVEGYRFQFLLSLALGIFALVFSRIFRSEALTLSKIGAALMRYANQN